MYIEWNLTQKSFFQATPAFLGIVPSLENPLHLYQEISLELKYPVMDQVF